MYKLLEVDFVDMATEEKFRFSIDRGGTFTDVYAECPGGKVRVMKLLSEDPSNYPDAPREAIKRILEEVRQGTFPGVLCTAGQETMPTQPRPQS